MSNNIILKINKKVGLGLIASISLFALADFVGIANVKGSGGINIVGDTVEDSIAAIMPVGSVVLRMDNVNPTTIYGGTWTLLTGDASLSLGDGNIQSGVISGNNELPLKLKPHTHTINHGHTGSTTSNSSHKHLSGIKEAVGSGDTDVYKYNYVNATGKAMAFAATYTSLQRQGYTDTQTHNHTISMNDYTGDSGETGDADAPTNLNVRGARLSVNVWQRTN